ncbi:helix-turn-helix domain-containing protein [Flavobacterium sp. JP2137]|uniref:helix-turn-helix domain-containing protein n=1 Tax=Flavobacterium sp. JP2137 TaxID=3414510 RepID=UPI003D2FC057
MAIRLLLTDFEKSTRFRFNGILKVTFGLLLLQLTLVCFDFMVYIDMFLAPMLYLFVSKRSEAHGYTSKSVGFHLLVFTVLFLITLVGNRDLALTVNVIYLLLYSVLVQLELRQIQQREEIHNMQVFVSFCIFYMYVVSLLLIIEFFNENFGPILGFKYNFLFLGMLVMMLCFFCYLMYLEAEIQTEVLPEALVELQETPEAEPVDQQLFFRNEVVAKVEAFFQNSNLYLFPSFTLEDLSQHIEVPRVVLSDVMNSEMETGFYATLGKYRIEHAKQLLLTQDHYTIEALVYQCGFHSKSTFNKYFKQFVGQTPSRFRADNIVL